MQKAHVRDTVKSHWFYFKKNVFKSSDGSHFFRECRHTPSAFSVGVQADREDTERFCSKSFDGEEPDSDWDSFQLMTLDEIFNVKPLYYKKEQKGFAVPGLIVLMQDYLDALGSDPMTKGKLRTYMDFFRSERRDRCAQM